MFDRMLFELVTIGRHLPTEIDAMERALREARRHERGELAGVAALEDLEAGRLERPFDLLADDAAFEALFERTAPERIVDGHELLFEPTEALADGCTYVFPEGTFDLTAVTRAWGSLSDFPVDVTITGAGPDVTRLVFGDFGPRSPLVRFTLRDATLDCAEDGLFDHRNQPSVVTMDRVRVVRHDAGHGGAHVIGTDDTLIRMRDTVIAGGYGRSPQHAQLHDVRTSAFLGRFERCVFRQIDTKFSSVRDGAALAFVECIFEDLLDFPRGDPEDATARWNRDALAFDDCTFSFAEKDDDLRTRPFALASEMRDTPDADAPAGGPEWVTVLEHTFDDARVRRPARARWVHRR